MCLRISAACHVAKHILGKPGVLHYHHHLCCYSTGSLFQIIFFVRVCSRACMHACDYANASSSNSFLYDARYFMTESFNLISKSILNVVRSTYTPISLQKIFKVYFKSMHSIWRAIAIELLQYWTELVYFLIWFPQAIN